MVPRFCARTPLFSAGSGPRRRTGVASVIAEGASAAGRRPQVQYVCGGAGFCLARRRSCALFGGADAKEIAGAVIVCAVTSQDRRDSTSMRLGTGGHFRSPGHTSPRELECPARQPAAPDRSPGFGCRGNPSRRTRTTAGDA